MSLSGLWLHHGLRGGCAAPEPEAVAGATPLFRCPVWHLGGLGCARHPNLPGGRSESISPLQEGQRALEAAASRLGGGVASATVSLSASCPDSPPFRPWDSRQAGGSPPRSGGWSPLTGGETRMEGAAYWPTRSAVSRPRSPRGWPGPPTLRSQAGRRNRRKPVRATVPAGGGLVDPPPSHSGVSDGLPAGTDGEGATPGGQGRGVNSHLAPNPYGALGEGGRSRHGLSGPSGNRRTGREAARLDRASGWTERRV